MSFLTIVVVRVDGVFDAFVFLEVFLGLFITANGRRGQSPCKIARRARTSEKDVR